MVTLKQKFEYLADGNIDLNAWLATHHCAENEIIQKAAHLAETSSKGLTTFYGKPCIEQSLEMAEIILNLKLDPDAVAAAIMTSTLQHTKLTLEIITENLNSNVAKLVSGILKIQAVRNLQITADKARDSTQMDRLRKMLLAMASDIRVVLIKLAEQTCIMRGIKKINPTERKHIAQETLDIYAPLANRLGIGQLKWELEDLAFHYVNPEKYKTIANFLAERRDDREERIQNMINRLKIGLDAAHIHTMLSGRPKNIYSIYLKTQRKDLAYQHIYDYSAIRILVPTLDDCYTALSLVHSFWEHIPKEFDDYIAHPKSNGYKSIHTAVVDSDGKNFEIQIRTNAMHEEAEHGVAAHWIYKENKVIESGDEAKITFLRQLLDWHKDVAKQNQDQNQIENKPEDNIYVFTPAGDILDLSIGATPLDFAYAIHTELGHRCRGAKINGHIVPLTYILKTGERVDIITVKNGTPSRDWLSRTGGYLKTSRARAKVAQWFKQQDFNQHIESGKHLLEREFARTGIQHINLHQLATRFNFKDSDNLFAALGRGTLRIAQILNALHVEHKTELHHPLPSHPLPSQAKNNIIGKADWLTRLAKCCKPIPGDNIIGYITQGRGVSIHKQDCSNIAHLMLDNNARLVPLSWDHEHAGAYYVDFYIQANGREESLREITALLSNMKIDLIALNSSINKKDSTTSVTMTVQLNDLSQLQNILTQIGQLPHVMNIKRISK